jgi:DNA polymerase-3 subunit epsilon
VGFLSIEMERKGLLPLQTPVLCTSLLARVLFPESTNHKLQTLVQFFKFEKNQAHRAYDDAISCLNVALKCIEKIGWEKTLADVLKVQNKNIVWQHFYLSEVRRNPTMAIIMDAIIAGEKTRIIYRQNSTNSDEIIQPHGLVRSPDGDYLFAYSEKEKKVRRYYLNRILESELLNKQQSLF